MPETPTQPTDRAAVLDALATEIGTTGAANDTALRTMAKGFQDGLTEFASIVRDLAKGKAAEPPPHAEPDGDEEPDEDEEAPPPGAPMGKGGAAQDGEFVDGTAFLVQLQRENRELKKGMKQLLGEVRGLAAELTAQRELQGRSIAATGAVLGEMSKGLVGVQGMLRSTAAPSPLARVSQLATRDAVRAELEAAAPAVKAIPQEKLSKALQTRIIDYDVLNYFKRSGKFDPDAAKHADIHARVLAA